MIWVCQYESQVLQKGSERNHSTNFTSLYEHNIPALSLYLLQVLLVVSTSPFFPQFFFEQQQGNFLLPYRKKLIFYVSSINIIQIFRHNFFWVFFVKVTLERWIILIHSWAHITVEKSSFLFCCLQHYVSSTLIYETLIVTGKWLISSSGVSA